jgi:hypothetical protein
MGEFLLKLLYNDSELCAHKVSQLFESRDTDSMGSILVKLPDDGREVRLKDLLPPCVAGGAFRHKGAGGALPRDDDVSRGVGSRLLAGRVGFSPLRLYMSAWDHNGEGQPKGLG